MTPAARLQAAMEIAARIADESGPADRILRDDLRRRRYAGSADRRAIVERVYGVLRRRARLDWWLAPAGAPPVGDTDPSIHRSRIIADLVLTDGLATADVEILFAAGGHGPSSLSESERAAAERLEGSRLDDLDMPAWVRDECPAWLHERLSGTMGEDTAAELAVMNHPAPVDLRVNTLKATPTVAQHRLSVEGIDTEPTPWSLVGLRLADGRPRITEMRSYRDGLIEVQDEGAQIVALITGARPGMTAVDFCAGAGGKALALAAAMEGRGRIVACDVAAGRLARAAPRIRRAGVGIIDLRNLDSEGAPWVAANAESADRVLLDVPCSGTGAWRREPEARWRLTPESVAEVTARQRRILASACRLVRPGGRLVYATCSVLAEENEEQMDWFLGKHPVFRVIPAAAAWADAIDRPCPPCDQWLRLSPASTGTDGFFVAVLERYS